MRSPQIGYGAGAIADYPWHLDGSSPWSFSDYSAALYCLSSLSELGIRFIDTAYRYGNGISEEMVGGFVNSCGEDFEVSTKIELGTLNRMRDQYEKSFERLKNIDCIFLHNPDLSNRDMLEEACVWIQSLGVLKYGFSTEPAEGIKTYYDKYGLNAIEFPYSKWDRRAEDHIFPWIKDEMVVVNRVLGGPKKFGKLDVDGVFEALEFTMSADGLIDVVLVGTINAEKIKECVEIFNELKNSRLNSER